MRLYVYALKGKQPSHSAVSCGRAIAVGKAGKKYMFANLSKSYGKTFTVQGAKYTVEEFIFVGGSGPAPGFVGRARSSRPRMPPVGDRGGEACGY